MAFNVLAALATGGLGVSGLELACGLPYPTPGPPVCRGASAADAAARVATETDTAMAVAAATAAAVAAAADATARRALVRARPWALRLGTPREGVVGGGTHVAGSTGHSAVAAACPGGAPARAMRTVASSSATACCAACVSVLSSLALSPPPPTVLLPMPETLLPAAGLVAPRGRPARRSMSSVTAGSQSHISPANVPQSRLLRWGRERW